MNVQKRHEFRVKKNEYTFQVMPWSDSFTKGHTNNHPSPSYVAQCILIITTLDCMFQNVLYNTGLWTLRPTFLHSSQQTNVDSIGLISCFPPRMTWTSVVKYMKFS